MGSSSSKSIDPEATETPVGRRSCSRNVFQTSCIRSSDVSDTDDEDAIDDEQVSDQQNKENGIEDVSCSNMSTSELKDRTERNKHVKTKRSDKRARVSSDAQRGDRGKSSLSGMVSRNGSGSSHNPSRRFISRFSFFPGNLSSRSSRAYPESSTSSITSCDDEILSNRNGNRTKTRQGCEFFPSCFMPMSPDPRGDGDETNSDNSDVSSVHELGRDANNNRVEFNGSLYSPRATSGYVGLEMRNVDRRLEAREPVEQNVRFSRTLSVGRLRDRVQHRLPFPELASFSSEPEREVVTTDEVHETGLHLSNDNVMISTTSSTNSSSTMSSSVYGNRDIEVENMGTIETRYSNLLEHRSNFLERRRRIRSQVHALQRMGSHFENRSSHERSCILSGQHRTGRCSCRLNSQNPNDGTSTRGSISRIVLLAEALFEVLDEIHQQSVVLSSRPPLSSIGSVPAPTDVVEALPVKLYHKLPKHSNEEDAQCYICLVEYEDEAEVRVLPCRHEFHRLCIDKWLKEIHSICPLCRGDVCKTGSVSVESTQL